MCCYPSMALAVDSRARRLWYSAPEQSSMLWRAFRPMRRAGLSTALDTPLQLAGKIAGQGGKAARGGDVDGERLVRSALDLGSYLSKIPVGPVTRRARRGYEQWQEGEGTPLSVIMPRAN